MNRMQHWCRRLAVALVCAGVPGTSWAADLTIQSFNGTGQLTFNELTTATVYRVEWAPTPSGPWTNFTGAVGAWLDSIPATKVGIVTCSVPMCYRVVATVTNAAPLPRYVDNGDGTVTDNVTGLMWTKNAYHGSMTWADAMAYCDNLVTNGYSDWRLPGVGRDAGRAELDTLGQVNGISYPEGSYEGFGGSPFTGIVLDYYWSSTLVPPYGDVQAWTVFPLIQAIINWDYKLNTHAVWPVRGGL